MTWRLQKQTSGSRPCDLIATRPSPARRRTQRTRKSPVHIFSVPTTTLSPLRISRKWWPNLAQTLQRSLSMQATHHSSASQMRYSVLCKKRRRGTTLSRDVCGFVRWHIPIDLAVLACCYYVSGWTTAWLPAHIDERWISLNLDRQNQASTWIRIIH